MPDALGNIVVIGATGSGKSTLATAIAAKTSRRAIDLDDCHWRPNWQEVPEADFIACVEKSMAAAVNGWVVAGNYSKARPVLWGRAQTLVALDYSAPRVFWQLFWRTMNRSWTGKLVCNGNRETFAKAFCAKDSILLWFFQSFWRRRRVLEALIQSPGEYAHLNIIRFKHPKETAAWLKTL